MSAEGATHGDWDAPSAWADGDWTDGTGPVEGGEGWLGDGAGLGDGEGLEGEMLEAALEAALEEASEPLHAASLRVRLAEALQRWRWRDEEPLRRGARRASLTTAAGLAGLARLARWRQLQAGWRRLCAQDGARRAAASRNVAAHHRWDLGARRRALAALQRPAGGAGAAQRAAARAEAGWRRAGCARGLRALRRGMERARRAAAAAAAVAAAAEWRRCGALGAAFGSWLRDAAARRGSHSRVVLLRARRKRGAFGVWACAAAAAAGAAYLPAGGGGGGGGRRAGQQRAWASWRHGTAAAVAASRVLCAARLCAEGRALRRAWVALQAASDARHGGAGRAERATAAAATATAARGRATQALYLWGARASAAAQARERRASAFALAGAHMVRQRLARWRRRGRLLPVVAAVAAQAVQRRALGGALLRLARAPIAQRRAEDAAVAARRRSRTHAWARWAERAHAAASHAAAATAADGACRARRLGGGLRRWGERGGRAALLATFFSPPPRHGSVRPSPSPAQQCAAEAAAARRALRRWRRRHPPGVAAAALATADGTMQRALLRALSLLQEHAIWCGAVVAASTTAASAAAARRLRGACSAWLRRALRQQAAVTAMAMGAASARLQRAAQVMRALLAAVAASHRAEEASARGWRACGQQACCRWWRVAMRRKEAARRRSTAERCAGAVMVRRWREAAGCGAGATAAGVAARIACGRHWLGEWRRRGLAAAARAAARAVACRLPCRHALKRWLRAVRVLHLGHSRRAATAAAAWLVLGAGRLALALAAWQQHGLYEQRLLLRWRRVRIARRGWTALRCCAAQPIAAQRRAAVAGAVWQRTACTQVLRRLRQRSEQQHRVETWAASAAASVAGQESVVRATVLGGRRRPAAADIERCGGIAVAAAQRQRAGWEAWRCARLQLAPSSSPPQPPPQPPSPHPSPATAPTPIPIAPTPHSPSPHSPHARSSPFTPHLSPQSPPRPSAGALCCRTLCWPPSAQPPRPTTCWPRTRSRGGATLLTLSWWRCSGGGGQ